MSGNKQGKCVSTDVAVPGDRNVIKKGAEKILKYKDLTTEIQRMRNVQAEVIPVIMGATETVAKSLQTVPERHVGGKGEIKELQTSAILCTAHRPCEVPM
jgi:hypothetical protein